MVEAIEINSFFEIEKSWDELYSQNSQLTYYQSTEYMRELWNNLLPYRFILRITPKFYVFKRDKRVIMILPLFKKWFRNCYSLYGFKAGAGYLDAIYAESITLKDITECFEALKNNTKRAMIHFEHVKDKTEFGRWIIENGGTVSTEGCTEIPLPDEYEDYHSSLSKHMKQNIRTAYNRLKTDEKVYEYESIAYAEISENISKKLQQLYIDRQVSKYGKNVLYRFFVNHVDLGTKIHKSNDVKVMASILYINNEIAAFFDAVLANDTVIIPRLAIADGYGRYSPGVILINESIKELIKKKVRAIDLTHGTEQYKLAMGGVVRHCVETDLLMY